MALLSLCWEAGWLSGRLRWLVLLGLFIFFHPCPSRVLRRQKEPASPSAVARSAGVGTCVASAQQGDAAGGWRPAEPGGTAGQRRGQRCPLAPGDGGALAPGYDSTWWQQDRRDGKGLGAGASTG